MTDHTRVARAPELTHDEIVSAAEARIKTVGATRTSFVDNITESDWLELNSETDKDFVGDDDCPSAWPTAA